MEVLYRIRQKLNVDLREKISIIEEEKTYSVRLI